MENSPDFIRVGQYGYVWLLDRMGTDTTPAEAARMSYGQGTRKISEDKALIRYLMRHKHTSPFEMCEMRFQMQLPIYVARQMVRHRTANINEESARYSIVGEETEWLRSLRSQSTDNKQGSGALLDLKQDTEYGKIEDVIDYANETMDNARARYNALIEIGTAREQARVVLPLATYTTWQWKCDLRNIFHFLQLRLDSHAQKEIREFAEAMAVLVKRYYPICYEAFEDYMLNKVEFSFNEFDHFINLLIEAGVDLESLIEKDTMITRSILSKREVNEFKTKIKRFI